MSSGRGSAKRDLYAEVTAAVVESLEDAGPFTRPWVELGRGAANPRNVVGRRYRGANTVLLWASALKSGYESGVWGTFDSWLEKDEDGEATRCVNRGEKGTLVTLWKPTKRPATGEDVAAGRADEVGDLIDGLYLRHWHVFAGEQVSGWEPDEAPELAEPERDAGAEAFFTGIGADLRHGGDRAFYSPAGDYIQVPEARQFADVGRYYSTLAHEHGHWTGHESRLARDFSGRFGSDAYAFEELVAELASAFTCATLGLPQVVREDHAPYVKGWLRVLGSDSRAVFTAASQAQKAADFLTAAAAVEGAPAPVTT